jgi:putative chitinase
MWPFTPAIPPTPDVFTKLPAALRAVAPTKTSTMITAWCAVLDPPLRESGFTTSRRIAAALGQMAVESAGFSSVSENLNYSAAALRSSWPSHFTMSDATAYARQPERIANRAYANRMGNGDEASGDGWRYRGAGLIQLTGRENHEAFAAAAGLPAETIGDYLRTAKGAAESAVWFLVRANALALADGWELVALSRAVNGGNNGLTERVDLSNAAFKALS